VIGVRVALHRACFAGGPADDAATGIILLTWPRLGDWLMAAAAARIDASDPDSFLPTARCLARPDYFAVYGRIPKKLLSARRSEYHCQTMFGLGRLPKSGDMKHNPQPTGISFMGPDLRATGAPCVNSVCDMMAVPMCCLKPGNSPNWVASRNEYGAAERPGP
jgi:hypothetical protein